MTDMIVVLLVVAVCLGFLLGLSAATIFNLILWMGFWLATGTVMALAVDAAMGLGAKACNVRGVVRGSFEDGARWYRNWHLRRTVRRYPHLKAMLVPQK